MKNKYLAFRWLFTFLLILFSSYSSFSQSFRYGIPLYKTFEPYEYKGFAQVFCIDELPNGNIIFVTPYDVFLYDGNSFNKLILKSSFIFRVVRVVSDDKIYIGGDSNFGYLKRDSIGKYHYILLSDSLPDSVSFKSIVNIYVNDDTVLFGGIKGVYKYVNDTFAEVINLNAYIALMHVDQKYKEAYYFYKRSLFKWTGKRFKKLNGASKIVIYGYQNVINENNKYLLFIGKSSTHKGIFKYDIKKDSLLCVNTSIDSLFNKYDVTIFKKLKDGRYIVSLIGFGLVFLNSDFTPYAVFDSEGGIPDTYVNWIYQDENDNIWVGVNNGLFVIYYGTNIFYYDTKKLNIKTFILGGLVVNNNNMVVGTANSLLSYRLEKKLNTKQQFTFYKKYKDNITIQKVSSFDDDKILAVGPRNILCVDNDKVNTIKPNGIMGTTLTKSFFCKDRSYVQNILGGYGVIEEQNGQCSLTGKISSSYIPYVSIELDTNRIGFLNNLGSFYSLTFDKNTFEVKSEKLIEKEGFSWVFRLNDTVYAITIDTLKDTIITKTYYYYLQGDTFLLAPFNFTFDTEYPEDRVNVLDEYITFTRDSTYLLTINTFLHWVKITGRDIHISKREFLSINASTMGRHYYDKTHRLYWFATPYKVYNIPIASHLSKQKIKVSLSSVIVGDDSLALQNGAVLFLNLDYKYNSISFTFSAPYFLKNDEIKYSYKLIPIDKNWSEYSTNNYTRYTNLPPGDYVFKLKAKNIFGDESNIYEYRFSVLPPWYMTWWAYLLYVIIVAIVIYLIVRYYTYRLKLKNLALEKIVEKRTKEIREKNIELITKNKQITESIEYAKKIQDAVVPDELMLKELFPTSFVLFRPRDIVSGDFFWVHKINDKENIIALADCTGHGVPGAFMSIIGNTLLNKIVKENGVYEPSEILSLLHIGVVEALQKGNEGDAIAEDGMDVIVCKVNNKEKTIKISSANQTGFFYIDGKFEQVYGDPFAIGDPFARQEQIMFSSIYFDYRDSAILYLTSDGYYDQFGGEGGNKKFTMKRFIELLERLKDKDVSKQRNELERVLNEWKGDASQLDDILVIGIKIG